MPSKVPSKVPSKHSGQPVSESTPSWRDLPEAIYPVQSQQPPLSTVPDTPHLLQVNSNSLDPSSTFSASTVSKKVITTRQFIFMALSSSIGAGLLLSTGQALAVGGPAPLFIGFAFVGLAIWITIAAWASCRPTSPSRGPSEHDK
ncbi:Uu.00g052480.m01.CDS01 [Anthostomella pinea]|uniref:Uu.00g052480.m01.CDS01 n=1 Tax=Anthostomella pinea TaxID=933095 RepID=A0AAI8VWA6_9PEZI|nr:Uu.00g052480.m01.CDS01 [Anthostomella pinea]